jgi:uncharacterized protein YndB with AHSA1/START domain
MTVTQQSIDGAPALRLERRLDHSIERVWRAVTDPQELARWFVVDEVPWTPHEDEEFEAGGETGRITELDPPRHLAWTWGRERYSFELSAENDDTTTLVFTHVFNPELGPGYQHAAGWEAYFDRLEAHLGGGFLSEEDAHKGMDERLASYRERFATA